MTHKNNQKPIKTPKTLWGVPKSPSDSLGGRKIPKDFLIIIIYHKTFTNPLLQGPPCKMFGVQDFGAPGARWTGSGWADPLKGPFKRGL